MLQNVSNHPHVLGLLGMCMAFLFEGKKNISIMVPFQHGGSLLDYIKRFCTLVDASLLVLMLWLFVPMNTSFVHLGTVVHFELGGVYQSRLSYVADFVTLWRKGRVRTF